ncbi:MAG: hypothetical protein DRI34_07765 [Deltaproteobacteria bacterium]|nr:MAG: hypothetical protein DRI34_07765 [Deltaproteobacteria bacterium]
MVLMLRRFCLYGFLKNQQYFEPYLVLYFLQRGLSFFQIGLLVACREVTVNLFEVLSGAVADVWGRRRSMMLSFCAYLASFVLFALAGSLGLLFAAMVLFGIGEAFRTGTHKAMIFSWLRRQGRLDERTRVYGLTRSWSKLGSALAVVIGTIFVLAGDDYVWLFWLSALPYVLGLVNFVSYPRWLDRPGAARESGGVWNHLLASFRQAFGNRRTRRLLFESMGFEGVFRASKDYLQPVLKAAALSLVVLWPQLEDLGQRQRAALLVGPVYLLLFLLSAFASRRAHHLVERLGGEDRAARGVWAVTAGSYAALTAALALVWMPLAIAAFVLLYLLQNLWRPLLISRVYAGCPEALGATVLSIENQGKTVATMVLAPLLGAAVDWARGVSRASGLWPVGMAGMLVAGWFLLHRGRTAGGGGIAQGSTETGSL